MKKISVKLVLGTALMFAVIVNSACSKKVEAETGYGYAAIIETSGDGVTTVLENTLKSAFVTTGTGVLTDSEKASLSWIKEEEKLAFDVYTTLYAKWGSLVFGNISKAEKNHMNAVVWLMQNYGLTDTAIEPVGDYSVPAFKSLYNDLVSKGNTSLVDALKVGAMIEELDIADLVKYVKDTSNENVIMVYSNLMAGSRNHLRAFNRNLLANGASYTPQYLDQATYQEIITGAFERGRAYKLGSQGCPFRK